MSIYTKTLQDWKGAVAAVLVSGGLVAALGTPSSAQTAVSVGKPAPVGVGTPIGVGTTLTRMVTIGGHVPDLARQSTLLGALPSDQALRFSITLPLRNQAALADLLRGLNDPGDARYGQYLTPAQFAAQFGPTQAQYSALIAYLESKGVTVVQTFPTRTYLSLSGTTAQVKAALGVSLKQFQAADGRVFHAPDTEVTVPSTVAGSIAGVVGLDDATPPKPLLHVIRHVGEAPKSLRAVGHADALPTPYVQSPGEQGTGPQGGFAPSDFRTAYGLNGTALNGTGQTVAIIEYGTTFNIKDALKYEQQFRLPRAPISIIPVDGGTNQYALDGPTETDLDIDCQLSMAPNASLLLFLQGTTGASTDAINAVLADGRAKQLSISYGFGTESRTATVPSATQVSLQTAYAALAAAGISVYVSTGDGGSAPAGTRVGIDTSSDEPSVCAVGGTALTVKTPGLDETYGAESTWNYNGTASGGADGGGVSKQWTIAGNATYAGATYQANAASFASTATVMVNGTALPSNVSATMRNVPDISCDASPETGAAVYVSGDPGEGGNGWTIIGGTSESAPLWAGYTALINQNRALGGLAPLGLPNNSLYPLAYNSSGLTASYTSLFHDINDGSSNSTATTAPITVFAAVTGFDDSTGLGTMQGAALIAALSGGTLYADRPASGDGPARAQAARANTVLASFELPKPVLHNPAGL